MSQFKATLFGKFTIQQNGRAFEQLTRHYTQEILAYLLLHRHTIHEREALASLLCEDCPTGRALKALRYTLWQIQSTLEINSETATDLLLVDPHWVSIHPTGNIWVDVNDFELAFEQVEGIPGHELNEVQVETLSCAISLYRGPLLDGCYADWVLYERERLQDHYLLMLEKLISYYEAHTNYERGLHYGECVLRIDHAHERIHQRMMRLYYLNGDRTAALRQYARCLQALDTELGVGPSHSTQRLYTAICNDQGDLLQSNAKPQPMDSTLPDLLLQLNEMQQMLSSIEMRIHAYLDSANITRPYPT